MSMSIDYDKLERVYAFSDFLGLLSNPEGLRQTLEAYKKESEALVAATAAKIKVDNVEGYVARQMAEVKSAMEQQSAKEAEWIKDKANQIAELQERATQVGKLQSEAASFRKTAEDEAQKASEAAKAAAADRATAAKELEQLRDVKEALIAERQALAIKEEKLRSLVG